MSCLVLIFTFFSLCREPTFLCFPKVALFVPFWFSPPPKSFLVSQYSCLLCAFLGCCETSVPCCLCRPLFDFILNLQCAAVKALIKSKVSFYICSLSLATLTNRTFFSQQAHLHEHHSSYCNANVHTLSIVSDSPLLCGHLSRMDHFCHTS